VPQYNPERGVVGKCDLCHSRLALDQAPACVSACPSGAIQVEIVKIADWRAAVAAFDAGVPGADQSISTTRITLPDNLPPDARSVDLVRVDLAEPHWPLVIMTVLTQLSVGAFATIWLLQLLGSSERLGAASLTSLLVGALALAASTLHLGRPVYAYRALKMWKRSWLSREVLFFTAFSGVACLFAASHWMGLSGGPAVGAVTVLLGLAGVVSTAYIYRVPSRPSWDTPFTLVQFLLTAGTLGPLCASAVGAGNSRWLAVATAGMAVAALVVVALRFFRLSASDGIELQATARLLVTRLSRPFLLRGLLLALGAIAVPLFTDNVYALWAALLLALSGELLGRYLFFVSVVPKHMTAPYLGREAA
jgi:DMSO reductase anchor subunit